MTRFVGYWLMLLIFLSGPVLEGKVRFEPRFLAAENAGSNFVLQGLTKAEARVAAQGMGLPNAQAAAVNSALSRATTTSTVKVTQYGSDVVVQVMRPGQNGFQVIETVVNQNGTKTVLQKAYDAAGELVHYHPKGGG